MWSQIDFMHPENSGEKNEKKKKHSLYSAWNPVTAGVAVWLKSNENTGFPTYVNLFAYFELLVLTMNFLNSTNSVSPYKLFQRVSEIAFQSPLPPPCCTTLALLDLNLCAVYPWAGPEHLLWSPQEVPHEASPEAAIRGPPPQLLHCHCGHS